MTSPSAPGTNVPSFVREFESWLESLGMRRRQPDQVGALDFSVAVFDNQTPHDGRDWVLSGQKVWSSMATCAQYGEAICRSDPGVPKHAGLTAFLVPLNLPGVTIRPSRQMTGGACFNEVFLDEVRVPDALRLGPKRRGGRGRLAPLSAH